MNLTRIAGAVVLAGIFWTFSACGTAVRYESTGYVKPAKHPGPPPHAPAHGYRHKHGNVVLVFDSGLDLYRVKGRSCHYFRGEHYYRLTASGWQRAARFEGPWTPVSSEQLPKGLRISADSEKDKKKEKNKDKKKK